MIGVEEEFFIADEETLFPISSTPKLILKLISRNSFYLTKSTMESPLDKALLRAGFPIIEVKTSPHKDTDCLLNEIRHHREELKDVAREEHVLILPTGLFPTYDPKIDSSLLCCALHVHISGYPLKKAFLALVKYIPELIAISANSPFIYGKARGKAMRALYSYAIGIPRDYYRRKSDVIINRTFRTVELRSPDTQIFSKDVLSLVYLVLGIVDSHSKMKNLKIKTEHLKRRRFIAAIEGKSSLTYQLKDLYAEIFTSLEEFGWAKDVYKFLMDGISPADFQINIARKYGIAGLIESLWASFQKDENQVLNSVKNVQRDQIIKPKNLPYLFLYFPIHLRNLCKKFVQDEMIKTLVLRRQM